MREVLAQMLLPLKEALLGQPIHNNLFHLIGTFHLQAIENLTNRALSRWGLFFLVEHVELHCGPSEEQVLCVFLLCFPSKWFLNTRYFLWLEVTMPITFEEGRRSFLIQKAKVFPENSSYWGEVGHTSGKKRRKE